jgi:hypothetical protein
MSITSAANPDVVKTYLDGLFEPKFEEKDLPGYASASDSMVFKQDTIDRASVNLDQFSGVGYFEERGEEESYAQASSKTGNNKVFSVLNYAKDITISKNFMADDQWSTVEKTMRDAARKARLTQDRNAFAQWNGAFVTTLTHDGVAMVSDSHVLMNGGSEDNKETGVLSEPNLDVARLSLGSQLAQDGTLGGHQPAVLLVPPVLHKTALEITKSELRSGTTDNDMNYYSQVYPGLIVKTSEYLSAAQGGSDTAWFLLSRDHGMTRWVRQGLETELVEPKYSPNGQYLYRCEYREVVGPVTWEGVVGSDGSV